MEDNKQKKENARTVYPKIPHRDQWVDYYKDFGILKKDKVFSPVEGPVAARIVTKGVDISSVKLMHRGDWIHLAELWLVLFLALVGALEHSDAAASAVKSIVTIVVLWAVYDIVIEYNDTCVDAEFNIPSSVHMFRDESFARDMQAKGFTSELVRVDDSNEAPMIAVIIGKLKRGLRGKLFSLLALVLVSGAAELAYLYTWSPLQSVGIGFAAGLPLAAAGMFLIDWGTEQYRKNKARKEGK